MRKIKMIRKRFIIYGTKKIDNRFAGYSGVGKNK